MQYTVHSTLYTVQCRVRGWGCMHEMASMADCADTLYTVHSVRFNTMHCTVKCTMHIQFFTLYTAQCTLYTVHCKLYDVHYTLYTENCTMYTVVYTVQCTIYIAHSKEQTDHCSLSLLPAPFTDMISSGTMKNTKCNLEKCI